MSTQNSQFSNNPSESSKGKFAGNVTQEARQIFQADLQAAIAAIKRPNILLLGKTGSGKSTLVNTVFGHELATTSHMHPQTRGFHRYKADGIPVNIIDSEGVELDGEDRFFTELDGYISSTFDNLQEQVHVCWYCISVGTARVLPFELQAIQLLCSRNIPVAVVLTQCDLDTTEGDTARGMRAVIARRFGDDVPCFEVSAREDINRQLGQLEQLMDWSIKSLRDDNLRLGFIAAQRISLRQKEEAAERRIRWYAGAAAGVGATPIPVSDSVVLTGMQLKMSADIYAIYGFGMDIKKGLQDFIQGKIASSVGKLVAGNVIKSIPGAGNVVGGVVNATVASGITYALGRTLSQACSRACKAVWEGREHELDIIFAAEKLYDSFKKAVNKQ